MNRLDALADLIMMGVQLLAKQRFRFIQSPDLISLKCLSVLVQLA